MNLRLGAVRDPAFDATVIACVQAVADIQDRAAARERASNLANEAARDRASAEKAYLAKTFPSYGELRAQGFSPSEAAELIRKGAQ